MDDVVAVAVELPDGSERFVMTDDYLEGHRAFYEKRDPRFIGR